MKRRSKPTSERMAVALDSGSSVGLVVSDWDDKCGSGINVRELWGKRRRKTCGRIRLKEFVKGRYLD